MFCRISTYPRKKSNILFHSFLLNRGALTHCILRSQFYTENAMFRLFRREKNMKTNLTKQNRTNLTKQNRTKKNKRICFLLSVSVVFGSKVQSITDRSPGTSHPLREHNQLYCVTYKQLRAIPM